jgi:20S proteasome alpha/beta subunit
VFTYGDDHGGLSVYVFDVSGSMISSGHTLIWDFSEHYKYCCSGEEREFIYYGDFPPLDCDGGEYAPDAFDDTGG